MLLLYLLAAILVGAAVLSAWSWRMSPGQEVASLGSTNPAGNSGERRWE